jgi:uncharacterized HAD superfamily protein
MRYFVDIDGTICTNTEGKYDVAVAFHSRIKKMNDLYDEGNEIIYWTARGGTTGIDWTELTTEQLKKWGVKYTELRMRKPHYDLFICDKAVNSEKYFGD